ncbi:MAG TPA: hypothetical protein VGK89_05480 [Candidatus Eisenbacteria bacterium]|jgi:hypothetical protein
MRPPTTASLPARRALLACALALLLPAARPPAAEERVEALERQVDALSREIEMMKLGGAADTARAVSRFGLGPAASRVYGVSSGVSIGGYGEALFQAFDRERESGQRSSLRDRVDLLRSVLYVGYKFDGDLLFNSEIELEHAGVRDEAEVAVDTTTGRGAVELTGEATMEFAYLDWLPQRSLGVRAGKLLVPLGLVNEMHEPPVFLGARRPEVETRIVPSTWSAIGAGIFGELEGGLSYRAYLMEGLDAAGFGADRPIRGGRQGGSQSLATHPAFAARADYAAVPRISIGGAIYTGDSWQREQPAGGRLRPRVTLFDLHARAEVHGVEWRLLYVEGRLGDAARLSDELGLQGSERLGRAFRGGYAEVSWDVTMLSRLPASWALIPYLRYEEYATQQEVAAPGWEDPANHGNVLTLGAAFKPHPNVVLKLDREERRNDARTETSQWSAALGYLF